jgi:hypothetical protein
LQTSLKAASEASSALQKKVWDAEAGLRDKVGSLEEAVRLFNSMAEDLEYVAGAATASATSTPDRKAADLRKKIRIELDIRAKKRTDLIQTDIRRDIIPRLQKLKGIITDSSMKLKGDLIIAQDALEECELQAVQLNETKLLLDSKLRRVEDSYKKERAALEQHASSHDRDMDALESKLIEIRDISAEETRAVNAKRLCGELKTNILTDREKHEKNKADVNQAVMSAAMALADYKEHIQARLSEVKRATEERLEGVLQLGSGDLPSVPSSAYSTRSRGVPASMRSVQRSAAVLRQGPFSSSNSYYIPPDDDEDMSSPVLPASVSSRNAMSLKSSSRVAAFPPPPPSVYDEVCIFSLILSRCVDGLFQGMDLSLEGGDLSELRADDLENSVVDEVHRDEDEEEATASHVVSNLAKQMNLASNTTMKARRDESDDSVAYEDSTHPALQMAYR